MDEQLAGAGLGMTVIFNFAQNEKSNNDVREFFPFKGISSP